MSKRDRDARRLLSRARAADKAGRAAGEKNCRPPPWCKPEALERAEQAEIAVGKTLDRADAGVRAELLAELRGIAVGAVRELGELMHHQTGRSAPLVRVQAARAVLALLEKAEAKVEDDRLQVVEAALDRLGLLREGDGSEPKGGVG